MKNYLLLINILLSFHSNAQLSSDTISAGEKSLNNILVSPWSSDWGVYISFGGGICNLRSVGALCGSLSVAKQSHLASLTFMHAGNFGVAMESSDYLSYNYEGFLIGESVRRRNFLLSFSAGVSKAHWFNHYHKPGSASASEFITESKSETGVPLEAKLFLLANNLVGIGLHGGLDLVNKFHPKMINITFVLGIWNEDYE